MEERSSRQTGGQAECRSGLACAAPFIVGVVAALIVGWFIFPKVLFSQKTQPVRFSHAVHVEGSGMECSDCHFFNEDGSYNGLPTTEKCAECHSEVMGEDPAEKLFVEEYVQKGKEVDWYVYQYQPDNVFFSHAVHNFEKCTECHSELYESEKDLCNACHPKDIAVSDTPPVFEQNRLTKYSKITMKMWQCEACHANENHYDGNTNANNACFTCHK